ncbi:MAG: hypothetical protein CFK52_11545 [Chloracidobacterium sp. CP2_5A]|nr:MAG: hypothetical protein CFK52_11545 [Chloracidobacterium sp. CP2_5A]
MAMFSDKKRILIVEDEVIVAEGLRLRLERLGYLVVGVTGRGEEAVELAGAMSPDLVLMDVRLAGDLDGVAAGEQIWTRFGLPVVYLTAKTDQETLERLLATQPAGYVSKPINDAAFQSAISIALQRDTTERAYRRKERYYASLLAKLEDAVFAVDADQRLVFLNQSAMALTGCEPGVKVLPHLANVLVFITEAGEAIDPIAQCVACGQEVSIEKVWCQTSAGARILANVEIIPFAGASLSSAAEETAVDAVVLLHRVQPTPQGALPEYIRVCAYCRDIMERDAQGRVVTKRFETYFEHLCGYQFTHGICSNCRDELMRPR